MAPFTWQILHRLLNQRFRVSGHGGNIHIEFEGWFWISSTVLVVTAFASWQTNIQHRLHIISPPLPEPPYWIFMPAPDPRRATEQDSYYVGWSFGFEIQGPSTSSMLFGNKVMSSGDVLCCWQFMWLDLMRKAPTGIRYTCVQASQRGDERRQAGGRIQQGRGGIWGDVMVSLSPYSLKCFKTVKLCEKGSINRMKILK